MSQVLSPPSPNVVYVVCFPNATSTLVGDEYVEPHEYCAFASRAEAEAIVGLRTTIPTTELSDFVFPTGEGDEGSLVWTNPTPVPPFFTSLPETESSPDRRYEYEYPAPKAYIGTGISWQSTYSMGGTNTPTDANGGVNVLLLEITTTHPGSIVTRRPLPDDRYFPDYEEGTDPGIYAMAYASSDGGQSFSIRNIISGSSNTWPEFVPIASISRIKAWRMPSSRWPKPAGFWTEFVNSVERPV